MDPTRRHSAVVAATLAAAILVGGHETFAEDAPWSQWRGPARDGTAVAFGTIDEWPAEPRVVWSVVAGDGQASPVADAETIFVFDRLGERERLTARRLSDGELLWQKGEAVAFKPGMGGGSFGAGPKGTPLVARDLVVTYGVTAILTARNVATGETVWRRDLKEEASDASLFWGNSMSPVIVDDGGRRLVIAQFGNDRSGGIRGYDLLTGEEAWRIEGRGSSYASPLPISASQLLLMTYQGPIGVSTTGDELWSIPFKMTLSRQNVASPLFADDVLIFGAEKKPLQAHRLTSSDGEWTTVLEWIRDDVHLDLGSPVVFDDSVCGVTAKKKGQLFCVSRTSGEDLWRSPPRYGDFAVLLVTPGNLLVLRDGGELTVLDRAAESYEPIAEYEVSRSRVHAHPVVLPGGLVVKSDDRLTRLDFRTQ